MCNVRLLCGQEEAKFTAEETKIRRINIQCTRFSSSPYN